MIYVDDFIAAAPTDIAVDDIIKEINSIFTLKDLGQPSRFLGCRLHRAPNGIVLSQKAYAGDILHKAGIRNCSPVATPMDPGWKPVDDAPPLSDIEVHNYSVHTGRLNWLATKTRPDVRYALLRLQNRSAKPNVVDQQAIKHLYRYLRGTTDDNLKLNDDPLIMYADASHANWPDMKSTESVIAFFHGDPIA